MEKHQEPPPYCITPQQQPPYAPPPHQHEPPYAPPPHQHQPPYAPPPLQHQPPYAPPPLQHQPPYAPPPQTTISPTIVTVNTNPNYAGSCPVCHTGHFTGSFTLCGWLCCICFFPIGILCCLCMREKRCSHCGYSP